MNNNPIPTFFEHINETKSKWDGISAFVKLRVDDNDLYINWLPSTSKDMDKWSERMKQNPIEDTEAIFKSITKNKIEGSWQPSHPGAGVWFKLNIESLENVVLK